MADPAEPRISVHGVPQSQYNQSSLSSSSGGSPMQGSAPGLGGMGARFNQHPILWSIGIGIAVIFVYGIYKSRVNAGSAAAGSTSGGTPASPDQMWGAQLDADYQQLIQQQNTSNGLLQQILNGIKSPSTSPPPSSGPPKSTFSPLPPGTQITAGAGGRWWATLPNGLKELVTGPGGPGATDLLGSDPVKIGQGSQGRWWFTPLSGPNAGKQQLLVQTNPSAKK